MAYWLLKTEPDEFSWVDLVARGAAGEPWTGVRNHQARNFMKAMTPGDLAFVYHTGDAREVVGVAEVTGVAAPEPDEPVWVAAPVRAVAALAHPVSLSAVKAEPTLSDMVLVKNSRLSVQPVTEAQWSRVIAMGGGLERVSIHPGA